MKLDFRADMTNTQKRTTKLITSTFFLLLTKKNFDEITVRELCRACLIPHSTFYNYFDDKYDLFRWVFLKTVHDYYPEMDLKMNHYDNIDKCADLVCDFIDDYKTLLTRVVRHNPRNGTLYRLTVEAATEFGKILAENCTRDKNFDFPYEVLFNNYITGFVEIFNQTLYENRKYSREQIRTYMRTLYGI